MLVTDFSLVEIFFDLFENNQLPESNYINASEKEVMIYRLLDYGFLSKNHVTRILEIFKEKVGRVYFQKNKKAEDMNREQTYFILLLYLVMYVGIAADRKDNDYNKEEYYAEFRRLFDDKEFYERWMKFVIKD